jgi:DNA replication licensing factor MCM3
MDQPLSIDHPDHSEESGVQETSPFEKYDPLLHGGVADLPTTSSGRVSRSATASAKKKEVLSIAFVKKYIQYAKARPAPVLTKGAADWIVSVYARLRNDDAEENGKRVCGQNTAGGL